MLSIKCLGFQIISCFLYRTVYLINAYATPYSVDIGSYRNYLRTLQLRSLINITN